MKASIIRKLTLLLVITLGGIVSCNNRGNQQEENTGVAVRQPAVKLEPVAETAMLFDYLEEMGDWVNSRQFPSLIKASSVYESLGGNILLIDIRDTDSFNSGHISGAVNKSFNDLPEYFESGIKPFEYDRIIIICKDGQSSSYTTSLLRLMGYGNVYSLRWGMSGWNRQFAEKGWIAGCSSLFEDKLEAADNPKPVAVSFPDPGTGGETGEAVATARFKQLFSEDLADVLIDSHKLFENPSAFFVINYDRRDKYESGHVPGAVRYKPGATLGIPTEMATIPSDRPVLVYCGTGHNSAFVTAYLRLFGYDAHSLKFGNNSFMHDKMLEERETLSWLPFTLSESADYKAIK